MNKKFDIIAPSDIGPTRPVMFLALLATMFLGLFIIYEREKLSDSRYDQQLRREVILDVFVIRENIQAQIFDRILALRELATIISQDPDVSDEVFGATAQRYLTNNPEVINVAMAPDLIITSIFPIEGNEKAIGLNYRENEEQFPKVQQAMETGDGLVTGPVNLVQGGQGLILRQPIFVKRNPEDEASQEPWGMLSMVVDYQAFLDGLGLPEFTKKYDILIHEIGAESHEQQTFFGDPAILDRDPEKLEFDFPFGVWELAATTAGGWPKFRPDFQRTLAIEYLVLVLVLGILWYVLQLVEAHRTNKRLLTNAIEALPDAFVIFDPKGRMVTCNSRYVELLGGDPELIVPGVHYRQLILAAIDRRNMLEAIGREQEWLADWEQKRKKGSFDHEITTLTGRVIRASDRTMPDGNTVGLRVDVTELKEAKVAADAANKAKSDFMAVLSHELRTPLTVMLGMARLSQSIDRLPASKALSSKVAQLPQEDQEILGNHVDAVYASVKDMMIKVENSGEHLMFLVNEILDFAKMEASGLTLNREQTDIADIIKTAADQISPMILEKGLELVVDDTSCLVHVDPKRIQQVLMNLLGNAAKFTPAGKISVTTQIGPQGVEVQVEDTGLGMPDSEVEKIFEPFHQVDSSNRRGIGGTGLGLAISREIAVAHGGNLTATTIEGSGSIFTLLLRLPPVLDEPIVCQDAEMLT